MKGIDIGRLCGVGLSGGACGDGVWVECRHVRSAVYVV